MDNLSPSTLLNNIFRLGALTSDGSAVRPKPIQKYCQNVYDISSIVNPLLEDLCKSPEEQLHEVLRDLDTAINEASGLIGNWHQTTSKIYFGWQIESVISDIQGCSLQLCQLANSLLPSLTGCACTCIEKLQDINYEHMFDLVKDVAKELEETSALNFPSGASSLQDLSAAGGSPLHPSVISRANIPGSPEADVYLRNLNGASPPPSVANQNSHVHASRSAHEVSTSQISENANGSAPDVSRLSLANSEARESSLEGRRGGSIGQTSEQSAEEAFQSSNLDRDTQDNMASSSLNGSLPNSGQLDGECDNGVTRVPSDRTNYSSDASGEVTDGGGAPVASSIPQREHLIPPRLTTRGQFVRRQASDRGFPRIISSSSMDARSDLSAIENQVRKLIEDLRSDSVDVQRSAASELRLLAKHNMENRIVIANCGAVNLLVGLLHSPDAKTQENAVTALLNLSINDNNKIAIANADAVGPLIHVLETGNPEAKENSAATLFSLSVIEENKMRIGRSGAIKPLVDLLGNGTPRGKKDAATALFNLSILHENKARIVQADAVRHLVELMDPAAGMVDKAVAVLANLATIPEGRNAIGQARGIPALVEVVELGSARGKENAAAALLQLCTNSNRFCSIVLQEGAVPPLVALSQSGTPRAREKAQALLSYFRSQRHGNSARR
nr:unnamed protein product [Digitaria exilis]